MTTLQTGGDCQTNDPNDLFPIALESLRFPLDGSMRIVFTGYFNGFNVEVKSADEVSLLYHMGCFGKGSTSRSKPKETLNTCAAIMRKRQFLKRSYWYKKFASLDSDKESDTFLKELDDLTHTIRRYAEIKRNKDIIDLVSSDEDLTDIENRQPQETFESPDKQDMVVTVPNSDSEGDDYFANFKPKCCVNKIRMHETLVLSLQESFFLSYGLGCLQIVNGEKLLNVEESWKLFENTESNFCLKYVIYHYYKSKGYIVKPGIKFGGDYLLYKEGPGINHAHYIVVIKSDKEEVSNDWIAILGHVRVATATVKEVIIAEVSCPVEPSKLPESLSSYSVREIVLNRKIPVAINDDIDY